MEHICNIPVSKRETVEQEKVERPILEITNDSNSIIRIDACDIGNLFKKGKVIHAIEVTVDAGKEDRMQLLIELIKDKVKGLGVFNRILVYLLFPEEKSIKMKELQLLKDWIGLYPKDLLPELGLSIHPLYTIRAIVLLQQNNGTK